MTVGIGDMSMPMLTANALAFETTYVRSLPVRWFAILCARSW